MPTGKKSTLAKSDDCSDLTISLPRPIQLPGYSIWNIHVQKRVHPMSHHTGTIGPQLSIKVYHQENKLLYYGEITSINAPWVDEVNRVHKCDFRASADSTCLSRTIHWRLTTNGCFECWRPGFMKACFICS